MTNYRIFQCELSYKENITETAFETGLFDKLNKYCNETKTTRKNRFENVAPLVVASSFHCMNRSVQN